LISELSLFGASEQFQAQIKIQKSRIIHFFGKEPKRVLIKPYWASRRRGPPSAAGHSGLGRGTWRAHFALAKPGSPSPFPRPLMPPIAHTIGLLVISNVFMTFAWYAHLRDLNDRKWYVAALVSWGIALVEYLFQVPANRIGFTQYNLGQLKILQEVITLAVFVPFALFYMNQPLKLNFLWASLCMVGAVYFMYRD
jgi:hypothetical protein